MVTDPISDYLTRIRNAIRANHRVLDIPSSNVKKELTRVLHEKGYIRNYKTVKNEKGHEYIKIALKYNPSTKTSAIVDLVRISKPGLRKYTQADSVPRVLNGLGIAIISTSRGIITDKEARRDNIGGEVLCYVY